MSPKPKAKPKSKKRAKTGGDKVKSRRQVGLLMSPNSPLSRDQKQKLKNEMHSGKVKVEG